MEKFLKTVINLHTIPFEWPQEKNYKCDSIKTNSELRALNTWVILKQKEIWDMIHSGKFRFKMVTSDSSVDESKILI